MRLSECCVLGCGSSRYKVPVHSFPKDPAKFEVWKAAVYSEKIGGLSSNELRKRIVCYRHFKKEDYSLGCAHRRLKCNVVPTLHLPEAVSISPEETNIIETMQPSCSYEVQHGGRTNRAYIPVRASTTEVKISRDVQPSQSDNLECGRTAVLRTSVCTSEMEVKALGSMHRPRSGKSPVQETRRSNKKRLLTGETNAANLTLQEARLYKAVRFLFRIQTWSNKNLFTVKERLRAAKKFFSSNYLQSLTARLTPTQDAFIKMQLRYHEILHNKAVRRRSFNR